MPYPGDTGCPPGGLVHIKWRGCFVQIVYFVSLMIKRKKIELIVAILTSLGFGFVYSTYVVFRVMLCLLDHKFR